MARGSLRLGADNKGFSLLELIVVVALLVIISLGGASLLHNIPSRQVATAMEKLKHALGQARVDSMAYRGLELVISVEERGIFLRSIPLGNGQELSAFAQEIQLAPEDCKLRYGLYYSRYTDEFEVPVISYYTPRYAAENVSPGNVAVGESLRLRFNRRDGSLQYADHYNSSGGRVGTVMVRQGSSYSGTSTTGDVVFLQFFRGKAKATAALERYTGKWLEDFYKDAVVITG